MIDQSLQLKLSQKLALAPQLQQAIRLLQLNRIELREYVQEILDANPLLEVEENQPAESQAEAEKQTSEEPETYSLEEADLDNWRDEGEIWQERGGESFDMDLADDDDGSLRDHLLWQINMGHFSPVDTAIAQAIVYALDEDGFLQDSIQDIRSSLAPELLVEEDEILAVLHRIQRMEPVGVASRDTAECIRVQLSTLPGDTAHRELAIRICRNYLDLLIDHDLDELSKETGADKGDLHDALELIRNLEPRPGARFDNRRDEYLAPDVYVQRHEDEWLVSLSRDNDPRLKLNSYYVQLLRQSGGKDAEYLQARLQEARWLMSSLDLRNQTLTKVARCLVELQEGFLERGEIAMQPLVLRDVAERIGVHESTVSRATTRKYMLTPRGLYELKYFFSSHVRTMDGGQVSATSVKARIQSLIEKEPTERPFSDQKLVEQLSEQGVFIARRTVAKYRESQGIGSSNQRKRLYKRMARMQEA